MASTKVDTPTLQAFLDAFNAHDVRYDDNRHWLCGDGKIARKDSFWKIVD